MFYPKDIEKIMKKKSAETKRLLTKPHEVIFNFSIGKLDEFFEDEGARIIIQEFI